MTPAPQGQSISYLGCCGCTGERQIGASVTGSCTAGQGKQSCVCSWGPSHRLHIAEQIQLASRQP